MKFSTATPATDQMSETDRFLDAVAFEAEEARTKYPGAKHQLAALVEEVGELAQALLQEKDYDEIWDEAVQVAAMACRVAVDGDEDFDTETTIRD